MLDSLVLEMLARAIILAFWGTVFWVFYQGVTRIYETHDFSE